MTKFTRFFGSASSIGAGVVLGILAGLLLGILVGAGIALVFGIL